MCTRVEEHVAKLMKESLYWPRCLKVQGSLHLGDIAQIRRITRARYHHAIKIVKREEDKIRMERMAETIASNNHCNLFFEVKLKGCGNILPACVDGASSDNDICGLFCKKYDDLYNSVPDVEEKMAKIKDEIQQQLCSNSFNQYVITVSDLIKGIGHLKHGKTDGTEGLYSDHLINGYDSLYVYLTMIFNALLIHGICPESMLLGTMVPIPQNKRQSLCNSDNYRAITLSSIIGKIVDWIILIKEEQSLSSSSLQFALKVVRLLLRVHLY